MTGDLDGVSPFRLSIIVIVRRSVWIWTIGIVDRNSKKLKRGAVKKVWHPWRPETHDHEPWRTRRRLENTGLR